MDLARFNELPAAEAQAALLACCGSRRWAARMTALRPFADLEAVDASAAATWWQLATDDWLEAFAAHPRIGERAAGGGAAARWSASEQATASTASQAVRDELGRANLDYEERFGHLFLICASGLRAAEVLAELRRRLPNDAATELQVAAGEQAKITLLRLARLFAGGQ